MPVADPLIILAPHRSYTSVVCAMLGQHPQLFGLPEMNFFVSETMLEWWVMFQGGSAIGVHGPLRVVAELYYHEQNEETINSAWQGLRQQLNRETGYVFREIATQVYPMAIVDKSPTTVYRIEYMERARRVFPGARFLHLVRHPLGHGRSVLKALEEFERFGALPRGLSSVTENGSSAQQAGQRMMGRSAENGRNQGLFDHSTDPPTLDPQMRWYQLQSNILKFLSKLPRERWMRMRGEDLLADPDRHLREIVAWMGLRTDPEAIEEMKHPERSPFACFGPRNAHLGNDPNFLQDPSLRAGKAKAQNLTDPVPWRKDGMGFRKEVQELARQFGYE